MLPHHINNILIDEQKVNQRVIELAEQIGKDYAGKNFVLIGILRGSFVFIADLVRRLHLCGARPRIDFTMMESYGAGTTSSGVVRVTKDLSINLAGTDVLLVDDILDTGRTLSFACSLMKEKGAHEVRTCVFLDKPSQRVIPIEADYAGFKIGDEFVIGYGLDYDNYYRELPYIAKVTFL